MKHFLLIILAVCLVACESMPALPDSSELLRKGNVGVGLYFTAKDQAAAARKPDTECGTAISRNEWRAIGANALDTLSQSLDVDVLQTCDVFGNDSTHAK